VGSSTSSCGKERVRRRRTSDGVMAASVCTPPHRPLFPSSPSPLLSSSSLLLLLFLLTYFIGRFLQRSLDILLQTDHIVLQIGYIGPQIGQIISHFGHIGFQGIDFTILGFEGVNCSGGGGGGGVVIVVVVVKGGGGGFVVL